LFRHRVGHRAWRWDGATLTPNIWHKGVERISISRRDVGPGFMHGCCYLTPHILDVACMSWWWPTSISVLEPHRTWMSGRVGTGLHLLVKISLQMTPLRALRWDEIEGSLGAVL
jgi:hypothetical protein